MLLLLGCAPDETPLPDTCNGHAELCDRPFDEVSLPATHNAMSNEADGYQLPNQPRTLGDQYADGVRGLLLDTYEWEDELYLCHGYCELGATPLVDALGELREFLDGNRGDVMAVFIEDYITPEQTAEAFDAADLTRLTYTWDGGAWPTLREMIADDTRLLVVSESGAAGVDWYQAGWEIFVETPYSFASVDEFNCEQNRGEADNPLFLLNHWVEDPFPSEEQAEEANAWVVLDARATECAAAFGRNPTLVAVDWYTAGDLFAVVDALNGV